MENTFSFYIDQTIGQIHLTPVTLRLQYDTTLGISDSSTTYEICNIKVTKVYPQIKQILGFTPPKTQAEHWANKWNYRRK